MGFIPKISSLYFDDSYRDQLNYALNCVGLEFNSVYKQVALMYKNLPASSVDEVQSARLDVNGDMFSNLKGRLDAMQFVAENALNTANKKADKDEIVNELGQIQDSPETFPDLSTLQSVYPHGKPGIMVTIDNGHKYIWNNGNWQDFGVYQAAGLPDGGIDYSKMVEKTLSDPEINKVNYATILDSFALTKRAKSWPESDSISNLFTSGSGIVFDTGSGDTGVQLPVEMDHPINAGENIYLNFDYVTTRNDESTNTNADSIEIWLVDQDGKLIKQFDAFKVSANEVHRQCKIDTGLLAEKVTGNKFYLLFSCHANYRLVIDNLMVNRTNNSQSFSKQMDDLTHGKVKTKVNLIGSNGIDVNTLSGWNLIPSDKFQFNGDEIVASFDGSGNRGFSISANDNIDTTKPVYVHIKGQTFDGNNDSVFLTVGDKPLDPANKIGEITSNQESEVNAKIDPALINQLGVGVDGPLTVITGGQNKGLRITELSISNTQVFGNLQDDLGYLVTNTNNRNVKNIGGNVKYFDSAKPVSVSGLKNATPGYIYKRENGWLKNINIYVKTPGNRTFTVGKIDQHNLIVDGNSFSLYLPSGYSSLDVEYLKIQVENGDQVFVDLSGETVYQPDDNHLKYSKALIQDDHHNSTDPQYKGPMMYETGYLIPFSYSVIDQDISETVNSVSKDVSKLNEETQQLINNAGTTMIKAPNGKNFRLVVDNNGNLSTVSMVPNRVAIFGNSLTKERGDIGMAASDQYHDWYHYVTEYIRSQNSGVSINSRANVSDWESSTTSIDRQNVFQKEIKPYLYADTDLVIIQLVDNVNSADRAATFEKDAENLINDIKQAAPKARVLWVAGWFVNDDLMNKVRTATQNTGATLVDITMYKDNSANKSQVGATRTGIDGTQWTITNPGEALHPGDRGMKLIGDSVISKLGF